MGVYVSGPVTEADVRTLTDSVVNDLMTLGGLEQQRRKTVAKAGDDLDALLVDYQEAAGLGRVDYADWVEPRQTLEAYIDGAVVKHDGKCWVSCVHGNMWEPGKFDVAWRVMTPDADVAVYVEDATYNVGDRVLYNGRVYRCTGQYVSVAPPNAGWVME